MKSTLMTARAIPVTMGHASIRSMAMSAPVNPATPVSNFYTFTFSLECGCYVAVDVTRPSRPKRISTDTTILKVF